VVIADLDKRLDAGDFLIKDPFLALLAADDRRSPRRGDHQR
jgi:hypothetical protein